MDGLPESPQMAGLAALDLDARVVYLPIRHHSPACAWHVERVIRELRPDVVLIEGPRDATPLIPLLIYAETRMPVAIFTTYIKRARGEQAAHYAAYYPFCDFSPELAAIRAAAALGIPAKFIDLTYPVQVANGEQPEGRVASLLEERYFAHSRFLTAACQRAGARDPDDLWDHLYENDYQELDAAAFFRNVLAYCALAREDYNEEMLKAEGNLAREAGMAAEIAKESGRAVVVTGGFHTVALPATQPKDPKAVEVAPDDAQVVLTRYSFEQLDRLNGYGSGMPSPEFYQRRWEGQPLAPIIVELGQRLRKQKGDASTDDEIQALAQVERLARLRGHVTPTREDLLDGIRTSFVKGAVDIEGVVVLTLARTMLAGTRIGEVPRDAGQPPIVHDFRTTAAGLKLDLQGSEQKVVTLDLYRNTGHRAISRLLYRLRFLDVPFATLQRGPDFVAGKNLDRVQEVWQYCWSPMTDATLIERAMYGATLEEAGAVVLLERFAAAEAAGQGGRAQLGTALVLESCRMGLHRQSQALLDRTSTLIAVDADAPSLVRAAADLLMLHLSREPLEAHGLSNVAELALQAYQRACFLLPGLVATAVEAEETVLDALNTLSQMPAQFGNLPEHRALLWDRLTELANAVDGNAAIIGAAVGLLVDEGRMPLEELVRRFTGFLHSVKDDGLAGPAFLRGLLRVARSVLWQAPELCEALTGVLMAWDEQRFLAQLPTLRLAFSTLTPRETDRVAAQVASRIGVESLPIFHTIEYTSADLLHAAELNRRLREALAQDGLELLLTKGDSASDS
jgi:hypothetical protein